MPGAEQGGPQRRPLDIVDLVAGSVCLFIVGYLCTAAVLTVPIIYRAFSPAGLGNWGGGAMFNAMFHGSGVAGGLVAATVFLARRILAAKE